MNGLKQTSSQPGGNTQARECFELLGVSGISLQPVHGRSFVDPRTLRTRPRRCSLRSSRSFPTSLPPDGSGHGFNRASILTCRLILKRGGKRGGFGMRMQNGQSLPPPLLEQEVRAIHERDRRAPGSSQARGGGILLRASHIGRSWGQGGLYHGGGLEKGWRRRTKKLRRSLMRAGFATGAMALMAFLGTP